MIAQDKNAGNPDGLPSILTQRKRKSTFKNRGSDYYLSAIGGGITNWEKLKTFLIVLFIILNIFLLTVMQIDNAQNVNISDQTISNTINVLKNNNILIDKSIIPKKIVNLNAIELKNAVFDSDFPKGYQKNADKTFSIMTDEKVNSASDIKKLLSNVGIDKNTEIVYNDNTSRVNLKIGQYYVFDIGINIKETSGKTVISGNWYTNQSRPNKSNNVSEIVPITGILIEFANQVKSDNTIIVESITLGYYVPESKRNLDNINTSATPCYRIRTSDNKSYFYNARNGEYLK